MRGSPFRVFISYSHEDDDLRASLDKHLAPLVRTGTIAPWHDHKIAPGQEWEKEISTALEASDLVLLLISPSFFASDYCYEREMARAIERHDAGSARVVPIIIKPCLWKGAPFAKLQALPRKGRAVTRWRNRDEAWENVAEGLERAMDELRRRPAAPRATATIFSVPFPRNPYFTGREDVLAWLAEQLKAGGLAAIGQVAAISGLGGIGKTQTAVEFAYRHQQDYRAVFFVPSENEADLVGGFAAMAETLGLPEAKSQDQGAAALAARRWLAENEGWLLILDNADTPSLLVPYLPAAGRGHVLITSREPNFAALHVDSEPLTTPPVDEARDFLVKRTRRQSASAAERQAAAELARELGNLPLALEQAAAYMVTRKVSFGDYLASYRNRGLELVSQAKPEAGTRHNPVDVTWSLNLEQVQCESPASIDLLQAAAFLAPDAIPDEFFLDGGSEISDQLGAALEQRDPLAVAEIAAPLLRYSLVERDAEKRTVSMHRLVQEVVKMDLGEAESETRQRVLRALGRSFPWPKFEAWPTCERLLPHLLAIANVAEEGNELAWLLQAGSDYLWRRARFAEAEQLHKRAVALRVKLLGGDHHHVATEPNNLPILYADHCRSAEPPPRAIREKSLGGDDLGLATSLNNLANLYRHQGCFAEAKPLYVRALAILERTLGGDHPDVAQSLNNLAILYWNHAFFTEAEPLYMRSLAIWEKSLGRDHPRVANSLNDLANLYRDQGRFTEAEPLYVRALAIRDKSLGGDHPDVAQSLNNLAFLYENQGRFTEADSLHVRVLAIRKNSLGVEHPWIADTLKSLARLRRKQGCASEADELETQAREVLARHEARNRRP